MIFNRSVTLSCLSCLLLNLTYVSPSLAQNTSKNIDLLVQSSTENNSTVESKAKTIVNDFFAQKYDSFTDLLADDYQENFTSDKLEKAYQRIEKENGKFTEIQQSQVLNTPTSSLVTLTLEFEKVTEGWIFIFNEDEKLIGVSSPISEDVQTLADKFLKAIIDEDYNQARDYLHPFLKDSISPETIQTGWANLISKYGKFEDVIDTNVKRGSVLETTDLVFMDLDFGKGTETILIIFDSSRNITGVDFIRQ